MSIFCFMQLLNILNLGYQRCSLKARFDLQSPIIRSTVLPVHALALTLHAIHSTRSQSSMQRMQHGGLDWAHMLYAAYRASLGLTLHTVLGPVLDMYYMPTRSDEFDTPALNVHYFLPLVF